MWHSVTHRQSEKKLKVEPLVGQGNLLLIAAIKAERKNYPSAQARPVCLGPSRPPGQKGGWGTVREGEWNVETRDRVQGSVKLGPYPKNRKSPTALRRSSHTSVWSPLFMKAPGGPDRKVLATDLSHRSETQQEMPIANMPIAATPSNYATVFPTEWYW